MLKSLIFLLFLSNCTTPNPSSKNITQVHKKVPQRMCITLYNPVCGKDDKTYSNSCNADVAGVEYTQGACKLIK